MNEGVWIICEQVEMIEDGNCGYCKAILPGCGYFTDISKAELELDRLEAQDRENEVERIYSVVYIRKGHDE